jgi:hypothetical protein
MPGALDPVMMPLRRDGLAPKRLRQGIDEGRDGERAIDRVGADDAHETDRLY